MKDDGFRRYICYRKGGYEIKPEEDNLAMKAKKEYKKLLNELWDSIFQLAFIAVLGLIIFRHFKEDSPILLLPLLIGGVIYVILKVILYFSLRDSKNRGN